MEKSGYIYLAKYTHLNKDVDLSEIKIGKTINPAERQSSLGRTNTSYQVKIFKIWWVDEMSEIEKELHTLLKDIRIRTTDFITEFFIDDKKTIELFVSNYMSEKGFSVGDLNVLIPEKQDSRDERLLLLSQKYPNLELKRVYKKTEYDVKLTSDGFLEFEGKLYSTPNKLYNNGVFFAHNNERGNSGTNGLNQFTTVIEGKTKRLSEIYDKLINQTN
jgi:hypothetical protein